MYSFKLLPLAIQLLVCTVLGAGGAANDAKDDHGDSDHSDSDSDSDDEHAAPSFFMASDTTTPLGSRGGGGWGQAFQELLIGGASSKDFGSNIASTVTFESSGMLENLLHHISKTKQTKSTYVTIEVCTFCNPPSTMLSDQYSLATTTQRSKGASVTNSS